MALSYTWKITGMKTATSADVSDAVVQVYWIKTGTTKDGISGSFNGATPFDLHSIDPTKFIPMNELTEELVLGWIQSIVVGSYDTHVEDVIQREIKAKTVTVVDAELPWAKKE